MKVQKYSLADKAEHIKKPEPAAPSTPGLLVRFVALMEHRQIQGIDQITSLLREQDFEVEHYEYKVVKKTEMHKPINPKHKDGPKQKVIIEDKINVNANLKSVGQLEWRVLKDPEASLLVQLNRTKGETVTLPLFFENLFEKEKQVMVTGLNKAVKIQLISKPDLKFQKLPEPIANDAEVRQSMIDRAARMKGMQSTARELLDFPGLPPEISKKISAIATGKKESLKDEEAINLILLSDLHSRYSGAFQTFQNEIIDKSGNVAGLSRQFEILTQKISTKYLVNKFADFLGENVDKCRTNAQVFSYLYQRLQQMEEKQIYVNKKLLDRNDLFKLIRSIVSMARSQFDPDLWAKCHFFLNPQDETTDDKENTEAIQAFVRGLQGRKRKKDQIGTTDLYEIYFINNIYDYVADKKVSVAEDVLSKQEEGILRTIIIPRLHLRYARPGSKSAPQPLFDASSKKPVHILFHSVHFIASAYGFLIGELLKDNLEKFLAQDKKELIGRFGVHFFDILYEQAVFEKRLHISRNQFAGWLSEIGLIQKPEELGHIPNEIETDYDTFLTPQVLAGSGQSTLDKAVTNDTFAKEYLSSRNRFSMFIEKIKKADKTIAGDYNPAAIFVEYFNQEKYDLRSPSFRQHVKNTFLYAELSDVVKESCVEIKNKLVEQSINKKIILKLPLKFSNVLFLGNTFEVPTGKFIVSVRVHTVPVKEISEDFGISAVFAAGFSKLLQEAGTPKRKALIQAMRMLGEYQKASVPLMKNLSIVLLDRHMQRMITKQKLINRDARFIKFKMPDVDKLIIGSARGSDLSKLFQSPDTVVKASKTVVLSRSFGEMVQSILYFQSVVESLESRREIIEEVKVLLNRFSKSLKKSNEWKTYYALVNRFGELISLPVASMSEKVIKPLTELGYKLNRLVTKWEYKNSVIAILHAEWKRKFPERRKSIYFYLPFVGDDSPGGKTNLLLEIRKARELINMLKTKRAIIFFPGATKEIQFNQMLDIHKFIREQGLKSEIYVEKRTLSEEKVRELCRDFYPSCFFNADELEPVKMPITQPDQAARSN